MARPEDYRAQRRLDKALHRLWFLRAERGAARSAASRCSVRGSRPLHILGALVWRVAKEKRTLETQIITTMKITTTIIIKNEGMHELVLTKQAPPVCGEMGPSALMCIHLEQMKPCSETGSYIPIQLKIIYTSTSFLSHAKIPLFVISRTHIFLWSLDGWILAARNWWGRGLCACLHTHWVGGGSWEG